MPTGPSTTTECSHCAGHVVEGLSMCHKHLVQQREGARLRRSKPHRCKWSGCSVVLVTKTLSCPQHRRAEHLRSKFGLAPEQYDAMLAAQDGKCALYAICGATSPGGYGKHWHVDHDHATNVVRGLLCWQCNSNRVGMNDVASAEAVLLYLRKHS
jgi:hypothetical protein